MSRPIITCACCGKDGPRGCWGWRRSCYERWLYNGKPDEGPPPPRWELLLEEYAWLRSQGLKIGQAAERLGVVKRTAERYEARLRRQRQDVAA